MFQSTRFIVPTKNGMQWFYTAKITFHCSILCNMKWITDEMFPSATSFWHKSVCGARKDMLPCKTVFNKIGKLFPFNCHVYTFTLEALSCNKNIHIQKCSELNELISTNTIHCEKFVFPYMLWNSCNQNFFQSTVVGNIQYLKWSVFESSTSHTLCLWDCMLLISWYAALSFQQ